MRWTECASQKLGGFERHLVDTREQNMASGYVVYLGRNAGKHKFFDHTTDLLRAVVAAALWARDLGNLGDNEIEITWATTNPFREQGAWNAPWSGR